MVLKELMKRESAIRIGVAGIGSIGTGILYQASITPGIDCVAIADTTIGKAVESADRFGIAYEIVTSRDGVDSAIENNKLAICDDASLIAESGRVEVFIDGTSALAEIEAFDVVALRHGKHVIMMNAEADLMYGPYLLKVAQENGVVYTSSDGDQPVVIRKLIDDIRLWGFDLVMAGNIKGFMDVYSNPERIVPEADKRGLDYEMCTSYTDGTKLCVEMAIVANAMNLGIVKPGMIGPRMNHVSEIFDHFNFEDIHHTHGAVVDYVLGACPKGGVFVIGYTDKAYQQSTLAWLPPDMGKGPYYLFYRPYHLCHFEVMASVAEAVLHGRAHLTPEYGFRTNVYAYAKTAIKKGEKIDGFGGFKTYGLIEKCADDSGCPGIPILLAKGAVANNDIEKDARIPLASLAVDQTHANFRLYNKALDAAKS